jgi:TatD DNase family protein
MASFYDTHAHLGFPDFAADFSEVLARARAAGIEKIICVGTDLESSARAVRMAEENAGLYAAVGWHPNNAAEAPEDLRPWLRELAGHAKVVAIGETGLDYHWREGEEGEAASRQERQKEIFRQQMEVAAERGLNCVIHQRDAFEETLEEMRPFAGKIRGVFHCFSEGVESMRRVFALGSIVSFTGILTFKNGGRVREALAAAGPGQFMLETDCPFLAPVPFRGKRCEPAYVREIAAVAAATRNCSLEELSAATCGTAREFFPKLRD